MADVAGAPSETPQGVPITAHPGRLRQTAEKEVFLNATAHTPIWSTHYLDPSLSSTSALSSAGSGSKRKRLPTGASSVTKDGVVGMARMAKEWLVPADARFTSDAGGVEVGVAVVDQFASGSSAAGTGNAGLGMAGGGEDWGKDMGRTRARVEVVTKSGGVKVDVVCIRPPAFPSTPSYLPYAC
jgi:hypothetical protein